MWPSWMPLINLTIPSMDYVCEHAHGGLDVQNVFQIVPHEERAFNSKLLISKC
jgi:hypothetical protein